MPRSAGKRHLDAIQKWQVPCLAPCPGRTFPSKTDIDLRSLFRRNENDPYVLCIRSTVPWTCVTASIFSRSTCSEKAAQALVGEYGVYIKPRSNLTENSIHYAYDRRQHLSVGASDFTQPGEVTGTSLCPIHKFSNFLKNDVHGDIRGLTERLMPRPPFVEKVQGPWGTRIQKLSTKCAATFVLISKPPDFIKNLTGLL